MLLWLLFLLGGKHMKNLSEKYGQLTNEEYREKIAEIMESTESNQYLRHIYILAAEKINRVR